MVRSLSCSVLLFLCFQACVSGRGTGLPQPLHAQDARSSRIAALDVQYHHTKGDLVKHIRTKRRSPGLLEMLSFSNHLGSTKGGNDLLGALIDAMKGVTATQVEQVAILVPLITANPQVKGGGFLKLLETVRSTIEGQKLVNDTVDLFASLTGDQVVLINNLLSVIIGRTNVSQGAPIVNNAITGLAGKQFLTKLLGRNSSVFEILPAASELLQTGSVEASVKKLLTDGTANRLLLHYIGLLNGKHTADVAEHIFPLLAPVVSGCLFNDCYTDYPFILLHEFIQKLQNETFREQLWMSVRNISVDALELGLRAMDSFGNVPFSEILADMSENHTVESFIDILGNFNTSILEYILGNTSFTDDVIDLIDHSTSVHDALKYISEQLARALESSETQNALERFTQQAVKDILLDPNGIFSPVVDNPMDLSNINVSNLFRTTMELFNLFNITKMESVWGNSTLGDLFIKCVTMIQNPEYVGQIVADLISDILEKGFDAFGNLFDDPTVLTNISFSKPLEAAIEVFEHLNITRVQSVIENSSFSQHLIGFLKLVQNPKSLGQFFGTQSSSLVEYVFSRIQDFLNDPESIKSLTFAKPLKTVYAIIKNVNINKLQNVVGNSTASRILVNVISALRRPGKLAGQIISHILQYSFNATLALVDNPSQLADLSQSNLFDATFQLIKNINVFKLQGWLGGSIFSDYFLDMVRVVKSPGYVFTLIRKYDLEDSFNDALGGGQLGNVMSKGIDVFNILEDEMDLSNASWSNPIEFFSLVANSINSTELGEVLGNSSLATTLIAMVDRFQSGIDINTQCRRDIQHYYKGLTNFEMWAFQMLDATGKLPSSILRGSVKFFGDFDECLETKTLVASDNGHEDEIRGHYCRLAFTPPKDAMEKSGALDTPIPMPADFVPTLEWHICLPRSCDERSLMSTLSILPLEVINMSVYKVDCSHDADVVHDPGALVAVVILGVIVLLNIIGTIYDGVSGEVTRIQTKSEDDDADGEQFQSYGFAAYGDKNASIGRKFTNGIAMVAINKSNSVFPDPDTVSNSTMPYEDESEPEVDYDGICRRLLLCFSLTRNTERILDTTKKPGTLACLHGIRVLSMGWIIVGHMIIYTRGVTDANVTEVLKQIKDFTMQAIVNASLGVDTFFLLSGCLVSYLFILEAKRREKLTIRQVVMYYVHRFWRIWPLYLVILMCYACLFKYILNGPLKNDGIDYDNVNCQSNWWTNALFINNVFRSDSGCMRWSWFLADDMQFYIIAPLTLVPIVLGLPIVGMLLMILLVLVQIATYAYKEYSVDGSVLINIDQFMEEIYFMPWCRVGVYALGLLLGYILTKSKDKIRLPTYAVVMAWQLFLAIGLLCTYITWDEWRHGHVSWSRNTRLVHETLSRPGWGLFVAWIIFICCSSKTPGIVNRVLSWSAWIPLSRLTYGAFLIHPILITYTDFSKRSLMYIDFTYVVYQFIGTFSVSYALSFVFTVLAESPFLALEKVALGRFKKD